MVKRMCGSWKSPHPSLKLKATRNIFQNLNEFSAQDLVLSLKPGLMHANLTIICPQ